MTALGVFTTSATGGPPALPPLLRLSTELLDRIISFSIPRPPKLARQRLAVLLSVHPILTPIIRRALYRKVSLLVGDPNGSDQRLLSLLEDKCHGTRGGSASEHVQFLRIRLPDPPEYPVLHPGQDPASALLARPHLDPVETLRLVTRAVNLVPHVRHVEFNLQVGVNLEGERDMSEQDGAKAELLRALEEALKTWAPRIETCISAVEDPQQRLQIWADGSSSTSTQEEEEEQGRTDFEQISPQLRALSTWHNLTRLDLWRVRLVLPRSFLLGAERSAPPTFRLEELVLAQCEVGGRAELEWLLMHRSVEDGASEVPRTSRLKRLVLDCVDFDEPSGSSDPIRAIFPGGGATLPFAATLEHLSLVLRYPLRPLSRSESDKSDGVHPADDLFAGLTALRVVQLGGPGITEPMLVSLFGPLDPVSSRSSQPAAPPPSSSVRDLSLGYLTSIRLSLLLSYLTPSPARLASSTFSYSAHPLRDLESLTFKTPWDLPRKWTWEERMWTRGPVWDQVHYERAELLGSAEEEEEVEEDQGQEEGERRDVGGWEAVEEAVKQLVRGRDKLAIKSGVDHAATGRPPLRLYKNRLEYTFDDDDDHEGDIESDSDSDPTHPHHRHPRTGFTRSVSEATDPNALFEPSEGSAEEEEAEQNAWVRRRIAEEEEYESDF
ncbi:hypothetical protein JCM10908_007391 [Rhodotorula pacifica]|uniref:uncharacterized protein n=1 Tax=Rhodotorula pacifica TaxID=1495444 RepID=UPI003179F30B